MKGKFAEEDVSPIHCSGSMDNIHTTVIKAN